MTGLSDQISATGQPAWLNQISEKRLPAQCKPSGFTYCPSMNLIAVASVDEQVNVYRLNGQHVLGGVYGTPPKNGSGDNEDDDYGIDDDGETREVKAIGWKADGKYLAVVCSDGTMRIISTTNGKTVHHLRLDSTGVSSEEQSIAVPSCFGWTTNFTDVTGSLDILKEHDGSVTLESLLSCEAKISDLRQLKADLPKELMLLDIESSLPKLSTLPSTNDDQDVFSSRNSIDSIFHGKKESGDTVDVLLVAFNDGTIHLKIYDCFEIGSVDLKSSLKSSMQVNPLLHGSHPLTSMHSLLYHVPDDDQLRLVVSDLDFITMSGRYLSLLASKVTQLQSLLRYIKQVQTQIQLEWKNTQELPGRYMRSANMDLEEKLGCDFTTAAYHLLITGDCWEPLREFLVDIVGDRGHKRWDKAVSTGYDAIRTFTQECLLPALERANVHLNTLIGLSKFHKLSGILGLWMENLQGCQETIDALTIFAHKVMIHSSEELRGFTAFSKWLKLQVDLQIAEPLSQTSQDLLEKADTIDYGTTSRYILGALTKSSLKSYLLPAGPALPRQNQWSLPSDFKGSFYEYYKQLLLKHENDLREKGETSVQLPYLNDLTARLNAQMDVIFKQIANTQRKGIYHRCPLELSPDCDQTVIDMVMNYETLDSVPLPSIYIAARIQSSPQAFHLYRVILTSNNGKITTRSTSLATIDFGSGTILSIKLTDDGTALLLWRDATQNQSTHLIQLAYLESSSTFDMEFGEVGSGKEGDSAKRTSLPPLDAEGNPAEFVRHTFTSTQSFEAAKLDVGRYEGRQVICILSCDGKQYRVYDIATTQETSEREGEGKGKGTSHN